MSPATASSPAASSDAGLGVIVLEPWDERTTKDTELLGLYNKLSAELAAIPGANVLVFPPPPIPGSATRPGSRCRSRPRRAVARAALAGAQGDAGRRRQGPAHREAYSTFSADNPHLYLDLDRAKAEYFNVPVQRCSTPCSRSSAPPMSTTSPISAGPSRSTSKASKDARTMSDDIGSTYVRSNSGAMVPIAALAQVREDIGANLIFRYNEFLTAAINGSPGTGYSTGDAMNAMEEIAKQVLPDGYSYEWTGMSYQEAQQSGIEEARSSPWRCCSAICSWSGCTRSWAIPLRS
jgi:multidrug efflux pump subunit AcrB